MEIIIHRIKGLEFENIIIYGANHGVMPLGTVIKTAIDSIHEKELVSAEQSLLYVAATRAKKQLVVTSTGKMTEFIGNQ